MNVCKISGALLFAFIICFQPALQAKDGIREKNVKASQLYEDGQYEASLEIWNDLANSGTTDPNLYFNIGNSEAMIGHIPESILAYEKALRFNPSNKVIREAIRKQRNKIANAVIPVVPFFLIEWYHYGLALLRPGLWVWAGLISLFIALLQWLISIKAISKFRKFDGKRIWLLFATGIFFIILGFLSYHQLHRSDEAIVMLSCEFRQAPTAESPLLRNLEAGEKVRITDRISQWNKVSLLNLDEGWIKKDCLKIIEVGK